VEEAFQEPEESLPRREEPVPGDVLVQLWIFQQNFWKEITIRFKFKRGKNTNSKEGTIQPATV
jgi:hypothetical protein